MPHRYNYYFDYVYGNKLYTFRTLEVSFYGQYHVRKHLNERSNDKKKGPLPCSFIDSFMYLRLKRAKVTANSLWDKNILRLYFCKCSEICFKDHINNFIQAKF